MKAADYYIDRVHELEETIGKATQELAYIIAGIENMRWDCDGEVYEALQKLLDELKD